MLPYVEQKNLNKIASAAYSESRSPFQNPQNLFLSTVVSAFQCPEDSRVEIAQQASTLNYQRVALSSYCGISGLNLRENTGALIHGTPVRIRDITDGTSNTLLVGERPPSHDFNLGWWYSGAGQDGSGNLDLFLGVEEIPVGRMATQFKCEGPKRFRKGESDVPRSVLHFWSLHTGGACFLLCDGSVRFHAYEGAEVLTPMSSIAGGEVATAD